MARVGRFQVMATLQAARAVALGLPLDEAKSWGLNRAIFYAAAKRGFRRTTAPSGSSAAQRGYTAGQARSSVEIGGEEAFLAPNEGGSRRFQIGDAPQTPEEFDREIAGRFPNWDAAWIEARQIVASTDPDDLKSTHRFYDQVYKPRRDMLARAWSAG